MNSFFKTLSLSFNNFVDYLPALIGGIVALIITFFLAHFISKTVSKYSLRKTKNALIANFIGKVISTIIVIFGIIIALGIFGLGSISNKILAGAGLTTFIIGFALKDIGENFLSGILLAFSRPYKIGSFIESTNIKGVVRDMTMRQTTVEAENGKIILIPNSNIIKNPLIKYDNNDNNLRQEFFIKVPIDDAEKASEMIKKTLINSDKIADTGNRNVKVIMDSLNGDKINLLVIFWFDPLVKIESKSSARTNIVFEVLRKLKEAGIVYSG